MNAIDDLNLGIHNTFGASCIEGEQTERKRSPSTGRERVSQFSSVGAHPDDSPYLDPFSKNKCNPGPVLSESPNYCPNSPGYFRSPDGVVVPAPCNSWSCGFCGPKRKFDLLARLEHGHNFGGYRWRFLTLTQQTGDPTNLLAAWARFRAYLAKRGYRFKFAWVKEFTASGKRHLHILVSAYIPWRIVRSGWLAATSGHSYIVDIRAHKGKIRSLGGYMSKYVTKSLLGEQLFKKYERRFGFSRWAGWCVHKALPEPGWTFVLDAFARYVVSGEYVSMPAWNVQRDRLERRDRVVALNHVDQIHHTDHVLRGGALEHRLVYGAGRPADPQCRLPGDPAWTAFWTSWDPVRSCVSR